MKNKVVVVTGASSGIGKACAWYFAKNGSKVILAARSLEKLEIIYKEIGDGFEKIIIETPWTENDSFERRIRTLIV